MNQIRFGFDHDCRGHLYVKAFNARGVVIYTNGPFYDLEESKEGVYEVSQVISEPINGMAFVPKDIKESLRV